MEATTAEGTAYYPRGERVVLKRSAVERERDIHAREAGLFEEGRFGRELPPEDRLEWAVAMRREVRRLNEVLAAIDAGVPDLPQRLYPGAYRREAA